MDDQRARPRPGGEVGIEVERVAVTGDARERSTSSAVNVRVHVPRWPTAGGVQATRGYSRSNRSTGTTKTVAPPTSTSSG